MTVTRRNWTIACVVVLVGLLAAAGVLIQVGDRRAVPDAALAALADQPAPTQPAVAAAASVTSVTSLPRAAESWIADTSARSGIPAVAVAAYGDAALRLQQEQPGCHLGWSTLAGIGTVESANGTTGGRTLRADGRSSTSILGPALDGTAGNQAIRDARGGWTTARGPMQFLPSTWAQWGADGDGDGRRDVDDIFDASLAAGRYLCADDHDLAQAQSWADAIFSYNHSTDYVQQVYAAAVAASG
jgi:membrane-bound lytic murein transglycosylase B